MNYEVEFKMSANGGIFTTYVERLADVQGGFWANKDGTFTKTSGAYAFVLPHMINYIIKLDE